MTDLVDGLTIGCRPGTPLHTVDGSEFAVLVSPLVPDADTPFLKPLHVRVAIEEPNELEGSRFEVDALGSDQWKILCEVKAHLATEYGVSACARAIARQDAAFYNVCQQLLIGGVNAGGVVIHTYHCVVGR